MKFKSILEEYIVARWMYSIGKEIMDDASYNKLHKLIVLSGELQDYVNRSWSSDPCPIELLKKYNLEEYIYEITLTEQTESIPTIDSESVFEAYYRNYTYPVHVSLKIDGFNTRPTYYNGAPVDMRTRGRGNGTSLDISSYLAQLPQTITEDDEVLLVGELALSNDGFRRLREMFPEKGLVSQRSAVRSAVSEVSAHDCLEFLAFNVEFKDSRSLSIIEKYQILNSWGFTTPYNKVANSYEELVDVLEEMNHLKADYQFKTDGIVIAAIDGQDLRAIRIGEWKEPIYAAIIKGYQETRGPSRNGVKLTIEDTDLDGSNQTLINATNFKRIVENELYPGTPVAFSLRSHSIANLDLPTTRMLQKMFEANPELITHKIREGTIFD